MFTDLDANGRDWQDLFFWLNHCSALHLLFSLVIKNYKDRHNCVCVDPAVTLICSPMCFTLNIKLNWLWAWQMHMRDVYVIQLIICPKVFIPHPLFHVVELSAVVLHDALIWSRPDSCSDLMQQVNDWWFPWGAAALADGQERGLFSVEKQVKCNFSGPCC